VLLVAGGGLALALRRRGASGPAGLLLATGALYSAGLVTLLLHDRLLVPLVPLFCVFLAHGVVLALGLVTKGGAGLRRVLVLGLALLGALSLERLLHAPVLDYAGDPVVQREAGEWLAARYPQDTVVMTLSPSLEYYFHDAAHGGRDVRIPWEDDAGVLAVARRRGVRLVVVPEWHLRAVTHPAERLWRSPAQVPGVRHVATLGSRERMFVYELASSAAGGR
jgi:hypothetical protein